MKPLLRTRCLGNSGHHTSQLVNSLLETSIKVNLSNIISTTSTYNDKNVFEKKTNQIKCRVKNDAM